MSTEPEPKRIRRNLVTTVLGVAILVLVTYGCERLLEDDVDYDADPVVRLMLRVGEEVYEGPTVQHLGGRVVHDPRDIPPYEPEPGEPDLKGVVVEVPPGTVVVPSVEVKGLRGTSPTVELSLGPVLAGDMVRPGAMPYEPWREGKSIVPGEPIRLNGTSGYYILRAAAEDGHGMSIARMYIRLVEESEEVVTEDDDSK